MSNIKIEHGNFPEEQIRDHSFTMFASARDLLYSVNTKNFDAIWLRTKVPVDRLNAPVPHLKLNCGRHVAVVTIDEAVPADEVKLVRDSAP